MSATRPPGVGDRLAALLAGDGEDPAVRAGALGSLAVLVASYLSVLYGVVDVVGGVAAFLLLVGVAVGLAVVFEEALTDRQALGVAAALLAVGFAGYLLAVPPSFWTDFSPVRLAADVAALLTGFSILQMVRAGVWALAVAPGPTFLVVYFGLRGEYVRGAAVGGATLGFFVLTGDSGTVGTLVGVLATAGTLGFSVVSRYGGTRAQAESIAVAVAVMILASATVTAVPADEREPIFAGATSVESDLRSTSDTVSVGGSVWLSPKVRFTVQADDPAYWRVKAYDRFTGTGWTRTGNSVPLSEADWPPGPRQAITQRVTAMTTLDVLPAAGEPTRVSGIDARLTPQGTLTGGPTLSENDSYTVVSRVPNATGSQLRDAGTDYPEPVRERYLQLPESTPDRVANLTDRITADAESPYDATRSVERWLEANKNYSTTVPQPDGDIANTFLFQRDAGYCVYFATTMATMLRSQDIPARYVVGYTPGQRVAEDEWVVRGLDSHAWVEVYFPEYGWIPFDPTPGSDRSSSETDRLEEARDEGVEGVDAAGSENGTWTPTTTVNASGSLSDELDPDLFVDEEGESIFPGNETTTVTTASPSGFGAANVSGLVNGTTTAGGDASSDFSSPALDTPGPVRVPGLRTLALWSVLLVGLAAGGRRSGVAERAYRAAWVRWQPATGDHRRAVEGAYDRVEYLLGREHRPRQDGETVREFLDAVEADERVRELAALRERARYAGEVDAEAARRARELADAVVGERVGVATRFNRLLS